MAKYYIVLLLASCLSQAIANTRRCRVIPHTADWPTAASWKSLNESVDGQLIATVPPAAVCHPQWPQYDNASCQILTKLWSTSWAFHSDDSVSVGETNWSNDTCLPDPTAPCSDKGYPVYVVNASKPEHVQAGVNFARENNVRLVVKGTGHDFRGRTAAPYSLSIWTRHLRGLTFHPDYQTCATYPIDDLNFYHGPAISMAAGENNGAVLNFANEQCLMVHVGSSPSVGVGGFLTGGGQTLLSNQKGLATDAVLEFTIVLPNGEIVTANACEHADIFWAVRGGGGSTFGVVLSFTVKAFASVPVTQAQFGFGSPSMNIEAFWEALTYMATQMPVLATAGVTMYANVAPPTTNATWSFVGTMMGLNKSALETTAILQPIVDRLDSDHGDDVKAFLLNIKEYPSFYEYWSAQVDATPMGLDLVFASRILDEKALNHPNFTALIREAAGTNGVAFDGVAGPGTHAYPSDFNAATPAWRTGYVHSILGAFWPPFNETAKIAAIEQMTNVTSAALRELAPDTGSYVNEASPYEPNYQDAFWGSNYHRLLAIKRTLDPYDVFWCQACAGSETWAVEADGTLCFKP